MLEVHLNNEKEESGELILIVLMILNSFGRITEGTFCNTALNSTEACFFKWTDLHATWPSSTPTKSDN